MESKLCRDGTVIVAGGGNSAGQAAMFMSESAKKVLLVIRGDNLAKSMSSYLSRRVETKDNIEILRNTEIRKMTGGRFWRPSRWKIPRPASAASLRHAPSFR
jgi:thioredoxin reductase (NADPH)